MELELYLLFVLKDLFFMMEACTCEGWHPQGQRQLIFHLPGARLTGGGEL